MNKENVKKSKRTGFTTFAVCRAFTLAEVLITIAIIGVVAAITLPQLINEWKTKSFISKATHFERQLGEAIRLMNVQSRVSGYGNTTNFVNELSRFIKVIKICDSSHITQCFGSKIILDDEKNSLDTKDITVDKLGHSTYGTEVVGVRFVNGVSAILAYNPETESKEDSEIVKFSESQEGKFHVINMKTDIFTMVYDTNSSDVPNRMGKDVRGINSTFNANCTQIPNEPYCVLDIGTNYKPIPCTRAGYNDEYCGTHSGKTNDYWAGARKACADKGMRVPNKSELGEICDIGRYGIDGIPVSGNYFSTSPSSISNFSKTGVYWVQFSDCSLMDVNGKYKTNNLNALCIK